MLVGKDGEPRREWLSLLVAEIAAARARGQEVIVVSSGAIALGARRLDLPKGGRGSLADAQAAASVGQIALAGLWAELLARSPKDALWRGDLAERLQRLDAFIAMRAQQQAGTPTGTAQ